MAAAAAGIWSHRMASAQAVSEAKASPMAGPATGTGGTSGTGGSGGSTDSPSSAAISANDFLTLLVTEMQNQDPTANTDPNEYINQLVNVNSLEQLISINQNLSTALGVSSTGSSSNSSDTSAAAATTPLSAPKAAAGEASKAQASSVLAGIQAFASSHTGAGMGIGSAASHVAGNLSTPSASSASHKVAGALSGHHAVKHGRQ